MMQEESYIKIMKENKILVDKIRNMENSHTLYMKIKHNNKLHH